MNLLLGDWVDGERARIVATLCDWLRIPSMSAHPDRVDDVRRSTEFVAALLADAGLEGCSAGRCRTPPTSWPAWWPHSTTRGLG